MTAAKANQPLSGPQKAALSILASQAYKVSRARFATDDETSLDDFRRAGQLTACRIESLRDVTQTHYLLIRGHWHTIIGNAELAFDDFLAADPEQEARKQLWYRLAGQVARLAEGIAAQHLREHVQVTPEQAAAESWAYAASICADKFARRRFRDLDARELTTLGFTIYNRASAMLGKGDAENRNKRQRRGDYRKPATQEGGSSLMQAARSRLAKSVQAPGLNPPDNASR